MPDTTSVVDTASTIAPLQDSFLSPALLSQIAGLFNVTAGLLLVGGTLFFAMGLFSYMAHFGLPGRDEGLHTMQNGLTMFFILIIMLGIVQFVQHNTALAITIIGAILLMVFAWAVFKVIQDANAGEDE